MFEKLDASHGNVVGYKVVGTITKQDYDVFVPQVEALVEDEGSIRMLLDMTAFKWEEVGAWLADWEFGRKYHDTIEKMALVGDRKWEEWLGKIAGKFYAQEAEFFSSADPDAAWAWLEE